MNDFGITEQDRLTYHPTEIADQVRVFLENAYDD
jgi:hypothetical protein